MAKLETRIREIGLDLFERMEGAKPGLFDKAWWSGQILEWAMRDPGFKTEMFRFVDVFPVLTTPQAIAQHIQEYLLRPGLNVPAVIKVALKGANLGRLANKMAASQIAKNLEGMGRNFIVGTDAREAIPKLQSLRDKHLAFTVDLLGEAVVSEAEAEIYAQRYMDLVEGLADRSAGWAPDPLLDQDDRGEIPRVNVSVKVSAMHSQLDPLDFDRSVDAAAERLLPIFQRANERGVFVNLDMEDHHVKDLTLALFKKVMEHPTLSDMEHAGVVIQAYHRHADADLKALLKWTRKLGRRITVRLVKGAYWDYETVTAHREGWPSPLWLNKPESDACFERLSEMCLKDHKHVRTAIASHNLRTISHAVATAERHHVPINGYEIQCLYGMAEPIKAACVSRGHRTRVYAPIGELIPGMAYLVRRLLENTSNESWLRQGFADDADTDTLLAIPDAKPSEPMLRAVPATQTSVDAPAPFVNEPLRDFVEASARDAFAKALHHVERKVIGRAWHPIVDGKEIKSDRALPSLDPSDGETVVGEVYQAETAHAEKAIEIAAAAWPAWRDAPVAQRAEVLFRMAAILRKERDVLAAIMVREVGKPWREADADVVEAIDFCDYYGREALRLGTPQRLQADIPGETNHLRYIGRGVCAVISPWNFPLAILAGMTTAALVAGNTVLVKPSGQSAVIGARLVQIALEAGVPSEVIHFLPGRGSEVGDLMVRDRRVTTVAFTGSREVGLHIWQAAGVTLPGQPRLKRVICEMGGKNAIIVDDDADLDEAVQGIVASAFGYAGQKCSACSRVVALATHHDALVDRLVEATRSLRVGNAANPGTQVGPVIDKAAFERLEKEVADARAHLSMPLGAERMHGPGYFVAPTIFTGVTPTERIFREELFGPVVAVAKAQDFDEALRMANDCDYALTGGIYSRSPRHLDRAREEFLVGNLYINRTCTGAIVSRQPFGGFAMSGGGTKAGGPDYLLQFLDPRTITENTLRRGFAPED